MSAVLARPVLALHLLSTNLKSKQFRVSVLSARHVHPVRLLCSLDNNNVTNSTANLDLGVGKHLALTDQVYSYILRHTREPLVRLQSHLSGLGTLMWRGHGKVSFFTRLSCEVFSGRTWYDGVSCQTGVIVLCSNLINLVRIRCSVIVVRDWIGILTWQLWDNSLGSILTLLPQWSTKL